MGRLQSLIDMETPSVKALAEQLTASRGRDNEWRDLLANVDHEMEGVCETVESMQRTLATIPTEKAPDIGAIRGVVCTEVAAVLDSLSSLKRAIQAIPAPVIPKPTPVDLTPVLQAIRAIPAPVSSPLMPSSSSEPRPREWTFDLEHDQYGNIIRVRATAGR